MNIKFWLAALCGWVIFGTAFPAKADAVLRPGDSVQLKIGGVPANDITAVTGEYMIDGQGYINMPNLGRVRIGGLAVGQAQSTLESAYRGRDIYTNPTIIITMQKESRFVNVGGEVKTPQRVQYTPDLTILSSINAAGGFTAFADEHKVRLLRGNEVTVVDVKKIRANPNLDVGLQPGDRVEVPQSLF